MERGGEIQLPVDVPSRRILRSQKRPRCRALSAMRFSIIITCHNQREFIRGAVESALGVRGDEEEVVVVDDASCDGSLDILRAYGDAIRLVSLEKNQGVSEARNQGARVATGEYLVFLDGDDKLLPWALKAYKRIVQSSQPKLILASMERFGTPLPELQQDYPREIRFSQYEDYMRKDRPFFCSASAIVVDRQSFFDVHGWSDEIHPMEDQDLVFKLSDRGGTAQILVPPTSLYRVHATNASSDIPKAVNRVHTLLSREKSGKYPGGRSRRFERFALLGGVVFYWIKKAARAGYYGEARGLLLRAWPMVFAATVRRLNAFLSGRHPCETIQI